ncbi:Arrestin-like N-terminal [Penicillium expansum]|nr:Arrestin-like N-terminal [Penicillium expansum]
MSANPPTQPTLPASRNRNSLLSKFRSPLGQRNRGITDFYIDPDDPWRSYFPGDIIKGTVVVTVVRPVRITHIVVCLHGYVKVFKNAIPAGEATPDLGFLGPGRGRRGAEYLGNGLATLFEDEVVLCGDGRLKEGIYKFRFEMGLPPYALPSSINFERGIIGYSLTSTLTRPTTMNPTLTCRRRVNLLENIDIAPFPAPRARIVTLEPISRRSKPRGKAKSTNSEATPGPDTASVDTPISGAAPSVDTRPPLSPSPSNVSSSSRPSESSQSFRIASDPSSSASTGGQNSEGRSATPSISDKTITAKAELLRAGVLLATPYPSQLRSTIVNKCAVRMESWSHYTVKVALTFILQFPSAPRRPGKSLYTKIAIRDRGRDLEDLLWEQTFAPLIVDPSTMTAIVKTSIRIPEDAFPTITRVPGAMINFRYYVEVVTDLRGKITSPDRFIPRFNMVSGGTTFSPSGQSTDSIRREKGVISVAFEVVVGTRDSQRGKATKRKSSTAEESITSQTAPPASAILLNPVDGEEWPEASPMPHSNGEYGTQEGYFPEETDWAEYPEEYTEHFQPMDTMVPPPEVEEPVDEKTRVRRHEEALLPSQPPDEDEAGPSTVPMEVPTAPVLPDDHHLQDYQHVPSPDTSGGPHAVRSAESLQTVVANDAGPSEPRVPADDKQELERHRLQEQASAPQGEPSSQEPSAGPSAPVFDEDDQLVGGTAHADESLPRYQR